MSTITIDPLANIGILTASHMTATVTMKDGTHFTIVSRPRLGVWMYNEKTAEQRTGARLTLFLDHLRLWGADGALIKQTRSQVVSVHILTN